MVRQTVIVIFAAIVVLIPPAIMMGPGCTYTNDWQQAERDGQRFAEKLWPGKGAQVECAHLDSDHDGYCSCTVLFDGRVDAIECGCPRDGFLTGCSSTAKLTGCRLDKTINRGFQINETAQ